MTDVMQDPSVSLNADGSYTIKDDFGGDWTIVETAEGWTADNTVQGFLRSRYNGAFRATYHTRDEVFAEFCQPRGSLADRLGHQSVMRSGRPDDYAHHLEYCDVCRDLDAGGDGLGNTRLMS